MSIDKISAITPKNVIDNVSRNNNDKGFSNLFENTLNEYTKNLEKADDSLNKAIVGDSEQYLDFLIQTEINTMNLQLTLEIRNKVVDAYNEIMRMQI